MSPLWLLLLQCRHHGFLLEAWKKRKCQRDEWSRGSQGVVAPHPAFDEDAYSVDGSHNDDSQH